MSKAGLAFIAGLIATANPVTLAAISYMAK